MVRLGWLAIILALGACTEAEVTSLEGPDRTAGAPASPARTAGAATTVLATAATGETAPAPPTDYLGFASGAVPIAVGGDAEALRVGMEQALKAIDGDARTSSFTPRPGTGETTISFTYRLPAATTFTRFAVPGITETPSPSQTFFRTIRVLGGNEGPDGAFVELGAQTLATHAREGERTTFEASQDRPVTFVKLELSGGINIERDATFLEFSEIIGEGRQEPVPLLSAFEGKWRGRGVVLELAQEGSLVTGCYDRNGELEGAVSGNILRALGTDRTSGVKSAFVLSVVDGDVTGVRSTNGAPFKLYEGAPDANLNTACSARERVEPPQCGATLYGIQFGYDSATIRPQSAETIASLAAGLNGVDGASVTIVGHTSSEGSDAYNLELSQRRAEAVVEALRAQGVAVGLSARGAGEAEPIADNASETGRSLNRRVEIACS